MASISVLIVDDHAFVRFSLANLLRTDPGLSISGEAANGATAIELYPSLRPDVVLLDLQLPDLSGVQVARQIRQRFPDANIIIFSSLPAEHEDVRAALAAGACGHFRKTADHDLLLELIHKVGRGRADEAASDLTTGVSR
jgi:DNA-binding NarL/FixJ family response regulator